jgi:menaquinone-specific isochorismate synthase
MLNVPTTPRTEPPAAWLRRSVPSAEDVCAFLQCGAVLAWSEDRWIIAWGTPAKSAHASAERPSFYAPDFMLEDPAPWRIYPHAAAVSPDGLAQQITGGPNGRTWREFDANAFATSFDAVQSALRDGALAKAVPAVFDHSDGALQTPERERALRALANLPSGLMPYGCWDENGGILGASPELLFEHDGLDVHTMAVAGTARAGTAPDEMMDDPKERSEHAVVLDDLTAQLAPLGAVTRGATRLWRIGILSHLRTDLRVTPERPVGFEELVRLLHPTPAVGVAPRTTWREWIPRLDLEARERFAAPFGLALPGETSRCLVAIRNVQWDRHRTRCGAGCGLVPGSNLARELSELRLKLAATRGNLGL